MAALHLEIVFVTLLLKFAWMENIARAPYGARMCRNLCMRTFGCSTYEYRPSGLICRLLSDSVTKSKPGNQTYYFLKTKSPEQNFVESENLSCTVFTRIFVDARNNLKCEFHKGQKDENFKFLLVTNKGTFSCLILDLKQMYVNYKEKKTYKGERAPCRTFKKFHSSVFAYLSTGKMVAAWNKKVFLCSSDSMLLLSEFPYEVQLIEIDEEKQMVFVCTITEDFATIIYVMNITTHERKIINQPKKSVVTFSLDRKRSLIYMVMMFRFKNSVERIAYNGTNVPSKILKSISNPFGLYIDSDRNILYVKDRSCVWMLGMTDDSNENIICKKIYCNKSKNYTMSQFVVVKRKIFILSDCEFDRRLSEVGPDGKEQILFRGPFNNLEHRHSITLIPNKK